MSKHIHFESSSLPFDHNLSNDIPISPSHPFLFVFSQSHLLLSPSVFLPSLLEQRLFVYPTHPYLLNFPRSNLKYLSLKSFDKQWIFVVRVKHQWMTTSKRTLMEGSVITSLIIYERNWSTSYQRETLWTRRLLDCYILILKVGIYQNEFSTYLLREPINSVIQYIDKKKTLSETFNTVGSSEL